MKNILSKYELNVKNDWLIVQCQHNFFSAISIALIQVILVLIINKYRF